MQNSVKKILIVVPMILFLCMSYVGTIAAAEVKENQITTTEDSSQNRDNSNSSVTNTQTSNENSVNATSSDSSNALIKSENSSSETDSKLKQNDINGKNSDDVDGKNGNEVDKKNNSAGDGKNNKESETENSTKESETENLPVWKSIEGKLFYVTKDGILRKTGWFKEKDENPNAENENEYYLEKDNAAAVGWKEIDKSWYYFDEAGIMQTGWKLIKYEWYHFGHNGIMDTGWLKDDGHKYYLNNQGALVVGKQYIDKNWYFFEGGGILQTGFYINNGKTYYSNADGTMVANVWIKTKRSKYYVKADSSIATGYAIIDNTAEVFDSNGKYIGPAQVKNHLFIKYLDVGNADCTFIKLPNGETVLIDTGTPETSKKVIDFLKEQNLKEEDGKQVIDYIIITHAHSDHIGGLASILKNFNAKKIYIPDIAKMQDWYSNVEVTKENAESVEMLKIDYEVYMDAVKVMKEKAIDFTSTKKGEFIDKDNILQFVESDKDFGPVGSEVICRNYWALNENSAVVYLNYGDLQALFTADIQWNAEKDFWTNDLLKGQKIDVLKVPHHGMSTSSTPDFLAYLKPSIGIIPRAKEHDLKKNADKNLISNGVSIYEASEKDGISIYATEENWTVGK